jgi:PAS domain S-box-containing protein
MPKVLLVDDEPNIRWTMAEMLKREGFEALTASDFESAVSALDNNAIDAALIDIVLPSKSGIEILQALKGREPYVPVIMMTGEPDISQIPEIVRAGAYDFLSKPVVKEVLISAVTKAVEKKRLIEEKRALEQQVKRHAAELELAVAERTRELEEAHNFLNTVLDSSTQHAIVALDTGGLVMLFNRGAELMFGCSAREAMGTDPCAFLGTDLIGSEQPFESWARRADLEGRHQEEVELRRADDERFIASVTMTPIRQPHGTLLGYLCIVKDLTEERRNEERLGQMSARLAHQEKIAALGRMAAQLAHEIKNPLAGLHLYSLHLKSKIAGQIPTAEGTLVDKIIDGINQLSTVAQEVLSFARPITLTPRPVDLNRIITASLALIEPQLSAKSIKVELNLNRSGARGTVDEAAMRSTLINLMLNSIQAMSEGGELKVTTTTANEGIRVEIADTGCGMTEEQIKHMFEPFYTTKSQGLGLGLFFAATVIEQHSGSVEVRSASGKGTEVTIKLPLEKGKADGASG